jgi:hypothetical protein
MPTKKKRERVPVLAKPKTLMQTGTELGKLFAATAKANELYTQRSVLCRQI